jgi:hypothetical protein
LLISKARLYSTMYAAPKALNPARVQRKTQNRRSISCQTGGKVCTARVAKVCEAASTVVSVLSRRPWTGHASGSVS